MTSVTRLKQATFIRVGFGAFAIKGVFQYIVDRSFHANDTTDFVSGALMGIGFGVLAIYLWLYGRRGHGKTPEACAR